MTEFEQASAELDRAEANMWQAEAVAGLLESSGLRWAWTNAEQTQAAVACDGQLIGEIIPEQPGQLLTGWTARGLDGTFHTARAAAAAVAQHVGVSPR